MESTRFAIGVFSAILLALSPAFIAGVQPLDLAAFIIPNLGTWYSYAVTVVPSLLLVLLAAAFLKEFMPDRDSRVLFWTAGILAGLAIFILLSIPIIPGVFLFATYLGGYLPLLTDDPCKRGLWKTVSAPKSLGALVVFIVVYVVASGNVPTLREQFVNQVVELSIESAGSGSTLDVNAIISPTVTPEEKAQLIERVKANTPNWSQLSDEQRQRIIDNYLAVYEQTKKTIYETLAENIHVPDKRALKASLRKQVENMPLMQKLLRFLPVIVGASVTVYYTLVELLAEIAAFLLGLPLVWLLRAAMKHS